MICESFLWSPYASWVPASKTAWCSGQFPAPSFTERSCVDCRCFGYRAHSLHLCSQPLSTANNIYPFLWPLPQLTGYIELFRHGQSQSPLVDACCVQALSLAALPLHCMTSHATSFMYEHLWHLFWVLGCNHAHLYIKVLNPAQNVEHLPVLLLLLRCTASIHHVYPKSWSWS